MITALPEAAADASIVPKVNGVLRLVPGTTAIPSTVNVPNWAVFNSKGSGDTTTEAIVVDIPTGPTDKVKGAPTKLITAFPKNGELANGCAEKASCPNNI